MAAVQSRAYKTAVAVTAGIFLFSVAFPLACFGFLNSVPEAIGALCILSLVLIPLFFVGFAGVVVQGARTRRVGKMEAWWWLSAPYAVTFPLSMALFHVSGDHDIVPLLALLALAATLSAIGWMLTTIYQVTISRRSGLIEQMWP